jgi:hypothetical protein
MNNSNKILSFILLSIALVSCKKDFYCECTKTTGVEYSDPTMDNTVKIEKHLYAFINTKEDEATQTCTSYVYDSTEEVNNNFYYNKLDNCGLLEE